MTTWVLLRGLTRGRHHWGGFVGAFEQGVADARVVALDLPGNGSLHRLRSPASVPALAAYCRDALARRGIEPPYRILAMSLGAMVAVEWARAHPAEVTHCVLINTSLRPFSPFYRRLRPGNYPALLRVAFGSADPQVRERAILRMTSAVHADDTALMRDWGAFRAAHPVARGNAIRQLLAAARYRAPVAPPAAAILLLVGSGDRLVHPDCSRAIAAAWPCELRLHSSAGHDLTLDDGAWVVRQVGEWLRGGVEGTGPGETGPRRYRATSSICGN